MPKALTQNYKLSLFIVLPAIALLMVMGAISASLIPERENHLGLLVTQKQDSIMRLTSLMDHITDAETGQRGYLLTGKENYLEPYLAAPALINRDEADLQHSIDDQEQQKQLALLNGQIASKLSELKETVDMRRQSNSDQALKVVMSGRGRDVMDDIRQSISDMEVKEQQELQNQLQVWSESAQEMRRKFLIGGALMGLLIVMVCALLYSEIERRKRLGTMQMLEVKRLSKIIDIQREIAGLHFDLDRAMQIITERTQDFTRAKGSIVEIFEEGEMVYKAASGTGAPHIGLRIKAEGSLSGLCVAENKVLKCDDSETDFRVDREACRRVGLRSMVVVPLRRSGRAVGVLKVMSPDVGAFKEKDVATLEIMATVLSAAISDALAARAIKTNNERLSVKNADLVIRNDELNYINAEMEVLATTDGLTGLKNRRMFNEQLEAECKRFGRYKTAFSLLLVDVDHFKKFNDTYGHMIGDTILKQISEIIKTTARDTDCVARYGGEEFAVIMPETDIDGALRMAERIRKTIADTPWNNQKVTASIGACCATDAVKTPEAILEMADKALYQSKNEGRNRVTKAA